MWTKAPACDVVPVFSQGEPRFPAHEIERSGHGRGMRRKLLPFRKTEQDHLDVIVVVQRAAEDAVSRNLRFRFEARIERIGSLMAPVSSRSGRAFPVFAIL